MFIPALTKRQLQEHLIKNGSTENEVMQRLYSEDEEKMKMGYLNNLSVFDKIVHNHFDKTFLEEIKEFLTVKITEE